MMKKMIPKVAREVLLPFWALFATYLGHQQNFHVTKKRKEPTPCPLHQEIERRDGERL